MTIEAGKFHRRTCSDGETQRLVEVFQQRESPKFFIVDRGCTLLYCSPNLNDQRLIAASLRVLEDRLKHGAVDTTPWIFERVEANVVLRIVPLVGGSADCHGVFVEPLLSRDALASAVKRFEITKREAAVLELLTNGFSTSKMARILFISEHTVCDHIKSLLRKTQTNRRSELIARIYRDELEARPHDGPLL